MTIIERAHRILKAFTNGLIEGFVRRVQQEWLRQEYAYLREENSAVGHENYKLRTKIRELEEKAQLDLEGYERNTQRLQEKLDLYEDLMIYPDGQVVVLAARSEMDGREADARPLCVMMQEYHREKTGTRGDPFPGNGSERRPS